MENRVYTDEALFESLSGFVAAEGIQIELTKDESANVKVLMCNAPKGSDLQTLYSGGWIGCGTALTLAGKLEVPTVQMGALLNHLKIKVKNCSLGCF
jgi:hypothetical protein